MAKFIIVAAWLNGICIDRLKLWHTGRSSLKFFAKIQNISDALMCSLKRFISRIQLALSSSIVPQLLNETGSLHISFEEGTWMGKL